MSAIYIIFTKEEVLISSKTYASWEEIQSEFDDYRASLGPWNSAEVASWLDSEYSHLVPSAEEQLQALLTSQQPIRTVSFSPHGYPQANSTVQ